MTLQDKRVEPVMAAAFVDYYSRLHQKSAFTAFLFDQSWLCNTTHTGDIQRWSKHILKLPKRGSSSGPFFSQVLDRLILLTPAECQKLLCAAVLLSRREAFRRCIDGGKIRALQAALGTATVAAILKSVIFLKEPVTKSDWNVESLLAEAFSHIEKTCRGQRQIVVDYIKIALPRGLPALQSDYEEADFENLLRAVCGWYPELAWLFG